MPRPEARKLHDGGDWSLSRISAPSGFCRAVGDCTFPISPFAAWTVLRSIANALICRCFCPPLLCRRCRFASWHLSALPRDSGCHIKSLLCSRWRWVSHRLLVALAPTNRPLDTVNPSTTKTQRLMLKQGLIAFPTEPAPSRVCLEARQYK